MKIVDWMDEKFYQEAPYSEEYPFRRKILEALNPEDRMLEIGAGPGLVPFMNFRGLAAQVCGIDLSYNNGHAAKTPLRVQGVPTADTSLTLKKIRGASSGVPPHTTSSPAIPGMGLPPTPSVSY